jgi:hypothetical protein
MLVPGIPADLRWRIEAMVRTRLNAWNIVIALPLMLSLPALAAEQPGKSGSSGRRTYKCVDANGGITYTESFDPAKCTGGGAQINNQGVSVRTIDRAKTPEEIEADKKRLADEAEAKKAREEKDNSDRVLLQSYTSADDIRRARDAEIKGIESDIATTEMSRKQQEAELTKFLAAAADQERGGRSVQEGTQKNIDVVRSRIKSQLSYMEQRKRDRDAVAKKYDERIARYERLKAEMEERTRQRDQAKSK